MVPYFNSLYLNKFGNEKTLIIIFPELANNTEGRIWYTTTKKRRFRCPKKNIITSTKFIIHVYIFICDMQTGCNYKKERSLNTSNSAFCPNIHLVFETIVNWLCNSILLDNTFLCQHSTNMLGMSILSIKFAVSNI